MNVKMYKAVDARDNHESLFAVRGNEVVVSTYFGKDDPWLSEDGFGDFNSYGIEDHDESRMINPVLVWESDDANKDFVISCLVYAAFGLSIGVLIGWCI